MKSSRESTKPLFFAAWGTVTLLFQVPLVQAILDDPESLSLGGWDWKAFAFFTGVTFLVVPVLVGALFAALGKVSPRLGAWLFALTAGCFFSMQVNYHYLQFYFMESAWRFYVSIGMFAAVSWLVYARRKLLFRLFGICALFSSAVFLAFLLQAAPAHSGKALPAAVHPLSGRLDAPPVLFLTFEKIVASYVMDENGRIFADRLPNLAAFTTGADFYPETHANCTATVYSLKTLYSGRVTTSDRNWLRRPTLRDIVGAQRKVFILLDLLTNYCDPKRHTCVRSIGREDIRGMDILIGWYKTYLLTVLPDPLEAKLTLLGWHFNPWFDLWKREEAGLEPGEKLTYKVGKKQMDLLKQILEKEGTAPNLYIMHNFISDTPDIKASLLKGTSRKAYEEGLELARSNLQSFDREIGKFLSFLKEKGIYDKALIVITSDTGYDYESRHVKGQDQLPSAPDLTRVFFALKRPDQQEGRVFQSSFRQIDVLPTLLADLGINPSPYHFDGVPVTDPSDAATLAQRPLEFYLTSEQAGVLHYRKDQPGGTLRRVR